jgi:hypothetical protein
MNYLIVLFKAFNWLSIHKPNREMPNPNAVLLCASQEAEADHVSSLRSLARRRLFPLLGTSGSSIVPYLSPETEQYRSGSLLIHRETRFDAWCGDRGGGNSEDGRAHEMPNNNHVL